MHGLKVRSGHVHISLRGRKVGVPQRPLQCERVPAPAKVVGSIAMPGSVKCPGGRFKAHLAAEMLDAAKDIPPAQLGPFPRDEDKPIPGCISDVANQTLAEFGTEG